MRQIYSRAEEVFSWVGDGCVPRYLEPAVSVFNKMLLDLPENFPHRWPGNDSELFGVLGRLFGEQYWRRVWIIQEITVASKVTILYGDCRYRWEDVSAILRQLQNVQSTLSTTIAEAIERAGHLLKFRDGYTGRNLINLFDALVWSRRALATDPRDKIFALLGLCHDGPIFVPVPNYKQDLGTIIADMSRMMMSLNKTLDFICLRGIGSRMDQTLPSWAPDWPSVWHRTLTIQEEEILKFEGKPHGRNPILEGSSNKILKVKGAQAAVITNLAAAFGKRDLSSATSKHPGWILLTSELRERKPELAAAWREYEARETIFDILTMAQLPNQRSGFEYLWRPEGRGAVEDLDLIQWIDDNAWFPIGPWTLREWSQVKLNSRTDYKSQPLLRVDKSGFAFHSSKSNDDKLMSQKTRDKTINQQSALLIKALHGILSSGMRLACINLDESCPVAMVHPEAEVGDEIFYIEGCRIPVVLRWITSIENDDRYKVIGGCYLGTHISGEFIISKDVGENRNAWSRQLNLREIVLH